VFWREERFAILLAALVAYVLVYPSLPESELSNILVRLFLTTVIGAGVWVLGQNPSLATPGRVLGTLALITTWASLSMTGGWFVAASRSIVAGFFLLTTVQLALYLARAQTADSKIVLASICGYLMIGLGFAIIFELMEAVRSGSFALTNPDAIDQTGEFIYFSLVTITTLGYGDITPTAPLARSLASLEAVIGQFYVAIIVAKLIALLVTSTSKD
jgi:voltage-gated potassium channel Kch